MFPESGPWQAHVGRRYLVTGADSGIGAMTADALMHAGAEVIRAGIGDHVDLRADLGTREGRTAFAAGANHLAGGRLDGVALVAGIGDPSPATVSVNYFGTLAALTCLRPLLLASPAPRALVVSSASSLSAGDPDLIRAALAGDEPAAIAAAERAIRRGRGAVIYRSTKIALNRWIRRHAANGDWAGAGIVLNAVAPGIVDTETVRSTLLADAAQVRVLAEALPQPLGMPGPARAVADTIAWLVGSGNSFMAGQVIFIDGGADAILRSDEPFAAGVTYSPAALARMIFWSVVARLRKTRRVA